MENWEITGWEIAGYKVTAKTKDGHYAWSVKVSTEEAAINYANRARIQGYKAKITKIQNANIA